MRVFSFNTQPHTPYLVLLNRSMGCTPAPTPCLTTAPLLKGPLCRGRASRMAFFNAIVRWGLPRGASKGASSGGGGRRTGPVASGLVGSLVLLDLAREVSDSGSGIEKRKHCSWLWEAHYSLPVAVLSFWPMPPPLPCPVGSGMPPPLCTHWDTINRGSACTVVRTSFVVHIAHVELLLDGRSLRHSLALAYSTIGAWRRSLHESVTSIAIIVLSLLCVQPNSHLQRVTLGLSRFSLLLHP